MRSILVLLILVMIGLNGKGQSVTALPDSVLSQCCLEVTLLNGNVTTVDWVFIQYITRDGTGTKLFVEYAPNFGGIQWETQIRIQDDFDDVLARSKFIVIPFTVGSTDYGINRNWIANLEENTTTGGTWIYGRFGTPTKRKFSAVEDYETMKNRLLACRPRAIVVAENGLYTEGDTVRMGGFLIEPTTITTEGYNWMMKDTLSKTEFGLDYSSVFGDTVSYMARRWGKWRNIMHVGRRYFTSYSQDTTGVTGIESAIEHSYFAGTDDPYVKISTQSGSGATLILNRFQVDNYQGSWSYEDNNTNPYYSQGVLLTSTTAQLGSGESGTGDPGNGVAIGTYGFGIGADEYVFLRTKGIDNSTATVGQFLQLQNATTGKSEWATIDLSGYLLRSDTAAMLVKYIERGDTAAMLSNYPTFGDVATSLGNYLPIIGGTLTGTGGAGFIGFPSQISAPGTPASGLNVYAQGSSFNFKGTDGYERQFASTLTGGRTYTLPNVNGTFALGTGTTNLVPLWTATNTLGSSNIQDNGTAVSILNSKPFMLGQWTTAGRPTGTDGYKGRNTTTGFDEGYFSSQWRNYLTSVGASQYQVPYYLSAGQLTSTDQFFFRPPTYDFFVFAGRTASTGQDNIAIGYQTGQSLTSGGANIILGRGAGAALTSGGDNVFFGRGTGANSTTSSNNVFIGFTAGQFNITGTANTYLGPFAGRNNTGSGNTFIGYEAGNLGTALQNSIFIGYQSGRSTTGAGNAFFGYQAGFTNTSGNDNTFIGYRSGYVNTTGGYNMFFGTESGLANTTGSDNFFFGYRSGYSNTSGFQNTFIGRGAGFFNTTGSNNYAGTYRGLVNNTTGSDNIGLGLDAGEFVSSGDENIFLGKRAGRNGTSTGVVSKNLFLGALTGGNIATGADKNILIGYNINLPTAGGDNQLNIGNTIYGTGLDGTGSIVSAAKIGILESNPSVPLQIKGITTTEKLYTYNTSTGIIGTKIQNGSVVVSKTATGRFGGNLYIEDTTGVVDNLFYMGQDDDGSIQALGSGPQITHTIRNSKLPGTFRWAYALRVDTSVAISALRIVYGDRYASAIAPVSHRWYAGLQATATISAFDFTSQGSDGKTAFNINSSFYVKQSGKVYFASDSTLSFNPSTDVLQLSQMGSGTKEAADLSKTQSNYIAGFATDGTVLDLKIGTGLAISGGELTATASAPTQILAESYNRITSTSSPQTFSSTISDNIVDQGSTQASFTFYFPASPVDGQILTMTWNNAISTLTLDGNGNTIVGSAVTTAVAGSQRKFKYCGTCTTPAWIKIY